MATAPTYPQPPTSPEAKASGGIDIIYVYGELRGLAERITGLHTLLDEREKQVRTAFDAAAKATDKAEGAQKTVNATQNEFRQALKDQAATFATLAEMGVVRETLNKAATRAEMETVKDVLTRTATTQEVERAVDRISAIEKTIAGGAGKTLGTSMTRELLIQLVPIIIAAIALYLAFNK